MSRFLRSAKDVLLTERKLVALQHRSRRVRLRTLCFINYNEQFYSVNSEDLWYNKLIMDNCAKRKAQ